MRGPVLFLSKVGRILGHRADVLAGRLRPIRPVLAVMEERPYELHLELTNLCNANYIFCPYQFQQRPTEQMRREVFDKALGDFVRSGGGSVGLTPIVGDALIHPEFLTYVRALREQPRIDRIWVTTNGILLDKHGVDEVLGAGLTSITISTSGFDEESYRRIYRSSAYARFRTNVQRLVERNRALGDPVTITIGLRTDRPLAEVLRDPDFQPVLEYGPDIDFTWSFTSAGGRIRQEDLPKGMKVRVVGRRRKPCVQLFNGPIVLPDGTVMACSCVAAVDAVPDLGLGSVMEGDLGTLWRSERMRKIRAGFGTERLNRTCVSCDMYRAPDLYRTKEGRERARVSAARGRGEWLHRPRSRGAFSGG